MSFVNENTLGRSKGLKCVFLRLPPHGGELIAHPQECQLPLSIAISTACLEESGQRVLVMDVWAKPRNNREILEELADLKPELIVLHVDSLNRDRAIAICNAIHEKLGSDLPVVAFGQYASAFPHRLLLPDVGFCACVRGEPEIILTRLASHLENKSEWSSIDGLSYYDSSEQCVVDNADQQLLEDLDSLPFPKYDLFDLDAYSKQSSFVPIKGKVRWGWILSSRGCPYDCLFCSPTLRKSCGQTYRSHSPSYVADLIESLLQQHGCNAFAFEDDEFSLSEERTLAICDEIISRGLKIYWTAQTHMATLTEAMIEKMEKAGCRGLCMGIESGNDDVRARIKGNSLPRRIIENNIALLRKTKINLTLYFMIGSPGETLEQMEETLALALKLKPMMIQLAYFTPYPGSRAWIEYMNGQDPDRVFSHYNAFSINLSAVDDKEVKRFFKHFYRTFYLNPGYVLRYIRKRLPYMLWQNSSGEFRLLMKSLLFILSSAKNGGRKFLKDRE